MYVLTTLLTVLTILLSVTTALASQFETDYIFEVEDEEVKPIEGANITVTYKNINFGPSECQAYSNRVIEGKTGSDGKAILKLMDFDALGLMDWEYGNLGFGPYGYVGKVIDSVTCEKDGYETVVVKDGSIAPEENVLFGGDRGEGLGFELEKTPSKTEEIVTPSGEYPTSEGDVDTVREDEIEVETEPTRKPFNFFGIFWPVILAGSILFLILAVPYFRKTVPILIAVILFIVSGIIAIYLYIQSDKEHIQRDEPIGGGTKVRGPTTYGTEDNELETENVIADYEFTVMRNLYLSEIIESKSLEPEDLEYATIEDALDDKVPVEGAIIEIHFEYIKSESSTIREWSERIVTCETDSEGIAHINLLDFGKNGLFDLKDDHFGTNKKRGKIIEKVILYPYVGSEDVLVISDGNTNNPELIGAWPGRSPEIISSGTRRGEGITFFIYNCI